MSQYPNHPGQRLLLVFRIDGMTFETAQLKTAVRGTGRVDAKLLGLVAERVNDLTYVQPEQIAPAPVHTPEAPYLDAIVQTDQGIVQLIAVDRVRDAVLQGRSQPGLVSPPESLNETSSNSEFHDRNRKTETGNHRHHGDRAARYRRVAGEPDRARPRFGRQTTDLARRHNE